MITVCFVYFKSLGLANLEASLYSLYQQTLREIDSIIIVDNDTPDSFKDILAVVDTFPFVPPVRFLSFKHNDLVKTHAWSTNVAVREVSTPWVLFFRADYLLRFDLIKRFTEVLVAHPDDWNGFITGNGYHLNVDIAACERSGWRDWGPEVLQALGGVMFDYTCMDTGVWMARTDTFRQVDGMEEALFAWGHAQTHFQHKMYKAGVDCVRIPEVMFYHPLHAAPRDMELANKQLNEQGFNIRDLWSRYEGVNPY